MLNPISISRFDAGACEGVSTPGDGALSVMYTTPVSAFFLNPERI
jgi:hypothetical protein